MKLTVIYAAALFGPVVYGAKPPHRAKPSFEDLLCSDNSLDVNRAMKLLKCKAQNMDPEFLKLEKDCYESASVCLAYFDYTQEARIIHRLGTQLLDLMSSSYTVTLRRK